MEFTVHLDGDPAIREEGFFESKVDDLNNKIKALEYDNAELVKSNDEFRERVTKLAIRHQNSKGFNNSRRNDRSQQRSLK